jgi:coenzyme F420-reducing hydrogenase gamma subunit
MCQQGVYGVFDKVEDAIDAATEAQSNEKDDYHDFIGLRFKLNELIKCDESIYGNPPEEKIIFSLPIRDET